VSIGRKPVQHFLIVQKNKQNLSLAPIKWLVGSLNLLIILPPLLFELGAEKLAKYFYFALGLVCHQRADRSFYLFGNALLHTKAEVWSKVPFDHIFTFHFRNRFVCGEEFGCKFGVCTRCTGMYLGLLIGLLTSEFLRQWRIPKIIPILLIIPMILDGGIQTIAYILAPERGFYESTNPRRFLTGLLFGFGVGYLMVSAIREPIAK